MDRQEYIDKCMEYVSRRHFETGGKYDKIRFDATHWMFEGLYERGGKTACEEVLKKWEPKPKKTLYRAYA